jgi:hypothetical protein
MELNKWQQKLVGPFQYISTSGWKIAVKSPIFVTFLLITLSLFWRSSVITFWSTSVSTYIANYGAELAHKHSTVEEREGQGGNNYTVVMGVWGGSNLAGQERVLQETHVKASRVKNLPNYGRVCVSADWRIGKGRGCWDGKIWSYVTQVIQCSHHSHS